MEILDQQKPTSIAWDSENWHYSPSEKIPTAIAKERLALYLLALDAINFCFWPGHHYPEEGGVSNLEYEHLAAAMARMAQEDEKEQEEKSDSLTDSYIFAPSRLSKITLDEMKNLLEKHLYGGTEAEKKRVTPLDNLEARCQLWNEVGLVLTEKFGGSAMKFLEVNEEGKSSLSAPKLVDRVVESFSGFRDYCSTEDGNLYFYKRAQICAGDLNAALKLELADMDHVTTFADYRVPQLLRHVGVLQYETSFGEKIDAFEEIEKGSSEENSIRAATVVAVEQLVDELKKQQKASDPSESFTAVTVDWYLWQLGERMHSAGTLKPHHRTRTTFY